MTTNPTSVFKDPYVGEILTTIHDKCVVDLADKTYNNIVHICKSYYIDCLKISGADPGFQVRGGGALKKIAPSGGRREIFWGISCEKSRFYANKLYCFQLRREARKYLGYFVWEITILRHKIIFFPILGGARAGCAPPPPGSAPGYS